MKGLWLAIVAAVIGGIMVYHFWPLARQAVTNTTTKSSSEYGQGTISFSDVTIKVKIPTSLRTQALGLGGRLSLGDSEGMYWDLSSTEQPAFWMKGMLIPLDFIWFNNGRVAELTADVKPQADPNDTNLPILKPAETVDGVVEVAAGFAARNGVQVGDTVTIDK